jgi:cytochrome c-type biogenesis protein CcmH/NrfF
MIGPRSALWALAYVLPAALSAQAGSGMPETGYHRVKLSPKPGTVPVVGTTGRDSIEHLLHCQCGGCRHDVFQCRTDDLMCSVGPQMHQDIDSMIAGGHAPSEIVAAFREQYGDAVLMAPPRTGFNWIGYLLPFGVILAGASLVGYLLRSWTTPRTSNSVPTSPKGGGVDASAEELLRIRAALQSDE